MNTNHKNYIIYQRILDDMYDEYHIMCRVFTDEDYYNIMKHEGIYDWYISEKLKEQRILKLNKICLSQEIK